MSSDAPRSQWAEVRRFVLNAAALLLINCLVGWGLLKAHESRLHYAPWETDSVLLRMPTDESFGLAILGTSHAYLFSRFEKNHHIFEDTLGFPVFNMAMPFGGGILPARFYLETFFEQGNRTKTVVYFLDPFALYTPETNTGHKFVYYEPLHLKFLWKMARNGFPPGRIFTYVRSKFSVDWLFQRPEPLTFHTGSLAGQTLSPKLIQQRILSLYPDGMEEKNFHRYRRELLRIAALCEWEGVAFQVVIPPTLLGPEPGASSVLEWLTEMKGPYGFEVRDWCGAMADPQYYYNLDHLNTEGVRYLVENLLRPMLMGEGASHYGH